MVFLLPSVNPSPSQPPHHAAASKTRFNTSHLTPLLAGTEADGFFRTNGHAGRKYEVVTKPACAGRGRDGRLT